MGRITIKDDPESQRIWAEIARIARKADKMEEEKNLNPELALGTYVITGKIHPLTEPELDFIIRNANYFGLNRFGWAHYRRADMLLAQYRGAKFKPANHYEWNNGLRVLHHIVDIEGNPFGAKLVVEAQHVLAKAFNAPSFYELLIRWQQEIEREPGTFGQIRDPRSSILLAPVKEEVCEGFVPRPQIEKG